MPTLPPATKSFIIGRELAALCPWCRKTIGDLLGFYNSGPKPVKSCPHCEEKMMVSEEKTVFYRLHPQTDA